MTDAPRYSVVVPAWNAAATIAESIRSALVQTLPPAEIVVVDDGSTDETAAVVAALDPLVRVVRQPNGGPGAATTRGLEEARFPLVATLDADDLWLPDKMARQVAWLDAHAGTAAVFSRIETFRADGSPVEVRDGWLRTTMVARRSLFEAIGPVLDKPGNLGDLVDWIARAREAGFGTDMMPDVTARRRLRPGSLSWAPAARNAGYVHAARDAILRRRARGEPKP